MALAHTANSHALLKLLHHLLQLLLGQERNRGQGGLNVKTIFFHCISRSPRS